VPDDDTRLKGLHDLLDRLTSILTEATALRQRLETSIAASHPRVERIAARKTARKKTPRTGARKR
jgi:hypothetical protein